MSELITSNNAKAREAKLAEQLFCAKLAYQGLNRGGHRSTWVFNDIVQLLKGNVHLDSQQLMIEINHDLTLRRVYMQLLQQFMFAKSGLQAAASDGDKLPARITAQFSLKFKRDKIYPTQVFVILDINHPKEHHNNAAISLHIINKDSAQCLLFPKLIDRQSQILIDDTDNRFTQLVDANSELFLI